MKGAACFSAGNEARTDSMGNLGWVAVVGATAEGCMHRSASSDLARRAIPPAALRSRTEISVGRSYTRWPWHVKRMVHVCRAYTFDTEPELVKNAVLKVSCIGGILAKTAPRGKAHRRVMVSVSPLVSTGSPSTVVSAGSTLSERVYRAFKRDIIHSVYQPGEP